MYMMQFDADNDSEKKVVFPVCTAIWRLPVFRIWACKPALGQSYQILDSFQYYSSNSCQNLSSLSEKESLSTFDSV